MISMPPWTRFTAAIAVAAVTPGPASRSPGTKTSSGCARGWISDGTGTPAGRAIASVSQASNGESIPIRRRISRRSTPPIAVGLPPRTTPPEDALSAMVSTMPIFQSWMRESTISSTGTTKSTARSASTTVTPGPHSREPSTNVISGSIFGCGNPPIGIGWCSRWNIEVVRWP